MFGRSRGRGGYYLSLIDSVTALCTFRDGSFHESSSDEEVVHITNLGGGSGGGGSGAMNRGRSASAMYRPVTKKGSKAALLDSSQVTNGVYCLWFCAETCAAPFCRELFGFVMFAPLRGKASAAG